MALVPPVDMGIDLKHVHRAPIAEGRKHRDRQRVVAAQQHRHGPRRQDLLRLLEKPGNSHRDRTACRAEAADVEPDRLP